MLLKKRMLNFYDIPRGKEEGLYLSRSRYLTPRTLAKFVDQSCGERPTILLISACFQVSLSTPLKGRNKLFLLLQDTIEPLLVVPQILNILIGMDVYYKIPASDNWEEVYRNTKACIKKEEEAQGDRPSLPQIFIGGNMKNFGILRK